MKIGQFYYNPTLLNQNNRYFVFKLQFYPPFSDLNGLKRPFKFTRGIGKFYPADSDLNGG